ncbi:MAG: hypothetical protein IT332_10010 [Ardenticatenales bacterium]|nr:hypothetical protein [Ardenticatenales bacterium]
MFYDHETVWQDPIATAWHDAATTTVDLDFMALAARQRSLEAERRRADAAPTVPAAAASDSARLMGAPTSGSPYLVLVRSPYELS